MSFAKSFFSSLFSVEPQERLKLLFLSLCYFCIIFGYTITQNLRETVFVEIVGKEYQPFAKIIGMFALLLPLFLYSKMVDKLRRYQLLCSVSIFYGLTALLFAYFLSDPAIGMINTNKSAYRLFGWLFYFFIEGYVPFVVSVFWAFANSISDQEAAKKNYGLMVAGSKIGGILSSLLCLLVLSGSSEHISRAQDVLNHQILLIASSIMSFLIPFLILLLMRKVPGRYLHGYEAVYKVEKERQKAGLSNTGIWSGLKMLINEPYVMGMFGILFFYELVNTVYSFQRICIAEEQSSSASGMSSFLYGTTFAIHSIGLIISLFGTRKIVETLGEKFSLMLIPTINFALLVYFMTSYTPFSFIVAYVVTKAVHLALSYPLKESLYIPTVKEIKFKSKSWIDSFGQKLARATAGTFNGTIARMSPAIFLPAHLVFMGLVGTAWIIVAFFLGKRYEKAIANNEVIGLDIEGQPTTRMSDNR